MNNARRDRLKDAIQLLNNATSIVDDVADKEGDAMDNMPENLQESERFSAMEEAVDLLNDATESIGEAIELIGQAVQKR